MCMQIVHTLQELAIVLHADLSPYDIDIPTDHAGIRIAYALDKVV